MSKAEAYNELMVVMSDLDSCLYETSSRHGSYEYRYEDVFGTESGLLGKINWACLESLVNDEKNRLIHKIRNDLDRYIVNS